MTKKDKTPASVLRDGAAIDRAMFVTRRRVILLHRQLGLPLVIWKDGKVVKVDPYSVELPTLDDEDDQKADKET